MNVTINLLWEKIMEAGAELAKENSEQDLVVYNDAKDQFSKWFCMYNERIGQYMKEPSDFLDRHKVAASIICAILKADIFGISKKTKQDENTVSFANEIVALNVALSYMYAELNKAFNRGEVPYNKLFDEYVFPRPYSCDKNYKFVICRDLYFSQTDFELCPLSIANLLFTLEDYSFVANHIERTDKE